MKHYVAPSVEEIKLTAVEATTDQVGGQGSIGGRG